ncbi:AAA family ATPase [Candidatus Anaplasma sp. TIGMIC]|uniref:AAA family ATPase n=1 Tax=Candidatus Anaplasma sp. TIGMIC TaxID=3020713 RepID=UPI0023305095|nr:AAA family ATPase [Candidatus Anaplasma sp. TIGMIC]MDB1135080.1 hypothetical protein [Candidatus Anaplasma sp. TIGMIC]
MDSIVGHVSQKKALRENPGVSTWLLCGKRGIGKASLSHAFARHVTHASDLEAHPDVIIIDNDSAPIGIDKVRRMKNFLHMSTVSADRKVAILDSVDGLSDNTMNSMLKVLEEPPKNSLILLISHNVHNVPIVIRSRCVVLNFHELSDDETQHIVGLNFPGMNVEKKAVVLYPGVPGMVTCDIEKEISLYESFVSTIRTGAIPNNAESVLSTDIPIHKVEYLALKAMHDTISNTLKLQKDNKKLNCIPHMLERYFKAQEIFTISRKLQVHKAATIYRITEIMTRLTVGYKEN